MIVKAIRSDIRRFGWRRGENITLLGGYQVSQARPSDRASMKIEF
jgi:hypothetical protein